jgi:hypothetical protein
MGGRKFHRPAISTTAGLTAIECGRIDPLRLSTRRGRVELRWQWLGAGNDPCNIRVFAGPGGGIRPAFFGFEPTSVLLLSSVLSGLFLCPLLKARP